MKLLLVTLASVYSCLLLADAFEVMSESDPDPAEQLATSGADSMPLTEQAYASLMRFLMRNNKQHTPIQKRYGADFGGMPYYRNDKRNNGVWIWMPAQGYVSVPRESQAAQDAAGSKPGKIMRYGK